MAMIVQHNLTAMNSNRMLGVTTGAQAKSTEKLSSGYKINRAADDAAGLSISEKMRKQIRGLSQASDNAQDGISCVQTAEGALAEVHDMLQRMNELAVKSANGTNSETDRQSIQDEIDQLVTEIDRVSETTKFNETYLLKGDENADPTKTYEYTDKLYTANTELYDSTGTKVKEGTVLDNAGTYYTGRTAAGSDQVDKAEDTDKALLTASQVSFSAAVYTVDGEGNVSQITAGTAVDVGTTIYGNAIDASKQDKSKAYTIAAGDVTSAIMGGTAGKIDGGKLVDAENNAIIANASVVAVTSAIDLYTVTDGKESVIKAGDAVKMADIAANNVFKAVTYTPTPATAVTKADFGKYADDYQLMDAEGNEVAANGLYSYFDDEGTYKGGLYMVDADGKRGAEATSTDVARYTAQADKETGPLTLDLHVGADSTKNNQIAINIDAMSASSIGVKGITVAGKDDSNALNAIETIKSAIQQVSEQRATLGAVQNRLEHTINNLDNIVENTTSAESQIRDTDMAEEMVEYSKNSILQQAGQSMLAQANQSNQGVLSLLG